MDSKLLDACVVLLGPQARRAGQALLAQLTVAMVRAAFRRLALRTHPDSSGELRSSARFIEASRAYELLMTFLLARGRTAAGPVARAGAAGTERVRPRPRREIFYQGPLPRRRLRLAEFLYYDGLVSWQTFIAALVWQRAGRPRFLEIARQLGIVDPLDVIRVLRARAAGERTGEAAARLRLLTPESVSRVLRIQRARQRPIGRYFVENTPLTNEQILASLRELFRHNARCGIPAAGRRAATGEKESA